MIALFKSARFSISPLLIWILIALGAIGLSLRQAEVFAQDIINFNGFPLLWQFIQASIHPDLSADLLQLTLKATLTTLAYAVCGTFFSVVIGIVGGILASEVWWLAIGKSSHFWFTARSLLAFPRAIHELIWGLFFVNLWGLDPLTAVLAIAIPFGAITAKVFSEILDETPRQSLQVLLNSGVPPITAFLYSLFPQAFLNLVSYVFYRFECSIRSAAVLGIIGAGGLGYEIFLSLQSLRYEQLWTFFYALFILNGLIDLSSARLRRWLGCVSRLELNLQQNKHQNRQRINRSPQTIFFLLLGFCCLLSFCFWYIHPDFSKLWAPRTRQLFQQIIQSTFPPDFSSIPQLFALSIDTIAMSILAITLAALGGLLLAFPAAHNFFLPGGLLNPGSNRASSFLPQAMLVLSRSILLICRAIPAPIWALVVLFVMFPGILPGAIALGLHNLGILGRLKAEVIENLDQRPLEALKAQGTANSLVFLYGVLPLTIPQFLAYSLYRWEVCTRETIIVGLVGAGGLGRSLTEQLSSFDYRALVVTLTGFLLLTFLVDWVSTLARRSLR